MRPPLDGSNILITGASSGLGLEFTRQLAPRARALALVARRVDRLEKLRDEVLARHPSLTVTVHSCDLADATATEAMLAAVANAHGTVDILINNAGMGDMGMYDRASWRKVHQMLEVNVVALSYLTRRLIEPMVARGSGGILNVSSGFGLNWMPGFAAYVGSKHFVTAFTESIRVEARSSGVVVSQVCPGPVATEFEEVMGNVTGQKIPEFIQLTAESCVKKTLAGFARGRALIVPGLFAKLLTYSGAFTPRWILRLFYGPVAKRLRTMQLRAAEADKQRQITQG